MAITIRRANPDDVQRLVQMHLRLEEHVLGSNGRLWAHEPEYADGVASQYEGYLADGSVAVLVAEEGEAVVGYLAGRVVVRPGATPGVVGLVLHAFVEHDWRGQGVGTALVDGLLGFFESRGVEDLSVRYAIGNREGESFWRRLGFGPLICTANSRPDELRRRLGSMA